MPIKLLPKESFKQTAEATGDLIWNKIADKITSLKNFTTEWFGNKWRNTYGKIYIPKTKAKKYWWCKIKIRLIKINIIYNNGIPKKKKNYIRPYNKSTI